MIPAEKHRINWMNVFLFTKIPFYSTVCFPYSSSKVVSMVGKFHDLKGNYAQDNPERGFFGKAHKIEGKWSESVVKLFGFAHGTDFH